jgi:hypothetical protein
MEGFSLNSRWMMAAMVNLRRLLVSALIGFGAVVATASSADAATTLGSTARGGAAQTCYGATLFVQAASTGPSYVVPSGGGVITSWSAHGFGAPAQLILKTVRESTTDNYLVRGSSKVETVAASGTSTFPARLSVAAGDEIALWVPDKAPCNYVTGKAGDVQAFRGGIHPEPAIGEVFGPTSDHGSGFRLNVSAELEPDADRDGYGDETQDGCPTDAAVRGPCPDRTAPRTTITKAPRPRVRSKRKWTKVKFAFRSSETSTFSCTLDGKTKPCSSPFKAKVKKGRHRFSVVATDLAGNVDRTPATEEFRVKRKKHRH